jgi:multiple sugar transport system permease protein
MLRPVILVALTIKTLDTYRAFDYLWIMTQGGPGTASTTLTIATYKAAFMELKFGKASAYGLLTLIFPLVLVNLYLAFGQRRTA